MRHDKVLVQIDAVAKGLLSIGVPLPSLSDKSSVKVQNRIDRPFAKGSLAGSLGFVQCAHVGQSANLCDCSVRMAMIDRRRDRRRDGLRSGRPLQRSNDKPRRRRSSRRGQPRFFAVRR